MAIHSRSSAQNFDTRRLWIFAKNLSKPKYQLFSEKSKNAGIKHLIDRKAFIECLNSMDDIDVYNPRRKRKILIVFDDMTSDIMTKKKFQAVVNELFI